VLVGDLPDVDLAASGALVSEAAAFEAIDHSLGQLEPLGDVVALLVALHLAPASAGRAGRLELLEAVDLPLIERLAEMGLVAGLGARAPFHLLFRLPLGPGPGFGLAAPWPETL
jgi:hypothetical protein